MKILIKRRALKRLIGQSVRSGPALLADVYFYRTLCTSGLNNVPKVLQFHDCNVTLYTAKKKIFCYFFVPPKETLSKEVAKESNNRCPEYKHLIIFFLFFFFFFNTNVWGRAKDIGRVGKPETKFFFWP